MASRLEARPGVELVADTPVAAGRSGLWWALAASAGVAAVLVALGGLAYSHLPPAMPHPTAQALAPRGLRWLQAWSWWDGAWYVGIADHGYTFRLAKPGQLAAAFFPAYPLSIRALTPLAGNAVLAGFLSSLAFGLGSAVLFYSWASRFVGRACGRWALAVFLLYPCSFFLFGVLYADSLFVFLTLGAFVLLERDRHVLAGLSAAVATATRPIGLAVAVGLWARTIERRGGVDRRDAGVLLAPLGIVAYAAYLWARFGQPLLFVQAERAYGQTPGAGTWLKLAWFRGLARRPYLDAPHAHLVGHFLVAVLAGVLVVLVFRRFGWGYGIFVAALVGGAALSTKNFVGMGRYVLAAFPCFAAAAVPLRSRPWVGRAVLGLSATLLLVLTELHSRNMLIS